MKILTPLLIVLTGASVLGNDLNFKQEIVDGEAFGHRVVGDIDGDGQIDIVALNRGGDAIPTTIVWYQAPNWKKQLISTIGAFRDFNEFRADDLELADLDNDGDLDIIGRVGPPDPKRNSEGAVCWFENPIPKEKLGSTEWRRHDIGGSTYAKDLDVADFNRDRWKDVVARGHEKLYIYLSERRRSWKSIEVDIHDKEGMEVADLDRDGDPDVVLNGYWIETPEDLENDSWNEHEIDRKWFNQNQKKPGETGILNCSKVALADINSDGCVDVILSNSERVDYPVSWYEAPLDPKSAEWQEHVIGQIDKCHNLRAADFDHDGDVDVFAGEMPNLGDEAPHPVGVFINDGRDGRDENWRFQEFTNLGSYSGQIGDIDNDGDKDIIGVRNHNRGPIEIWRNPTSDNKLPLDRWTYIQVDDQHDKKFGLALGDLTGDGYADIASSQWFYRNPGDDMSGDWQRVHIQDDIDAALIVDVDDDENGDVIAFGCNQQFWCEAMDRQGTSWRVQQIGSLPICNHKIGTQGYNLAQIVPRGKPEIIVTGDGIFAIRIPDDPETVEWPYIRIAQEKNSGEWLSAGDMDNDGDLDICAGYRPEVVANGVAWWENPGNGVGEWRLHLIGMTNFYADKFLAADMNNDGLRDIVVTEERHPGPRPDASLYWFEQYRERRHLFWKKHVVVTQYSMNSGDVADMDRDGDVDIIVGEHRMPSYPGERVPNQDRLQIWENDGRGNFEERVVDRGKDSHLGARTFDMDGDGDLDIVSIAWRNFQNVHLWRNDAIRKATH